MSLFCVTWVYVNLNKSSLIHKQVWRCFPSTHRALSRHLRPTQLGMPEPQAAATQDVPRDEFTVNYLRSLSIMLDTLQGPLSYSVLMEDNLPIMVNCLPMCPIFRGRALNSCQYPTSPILCGKVLLEPHMFKRNNIVSTIGQWAPRGVLMSD